MAIARLRLSRGRALLYRERPGLPAVIHPGVGPSRTVQAGTKLERSCRVRVRVAATCLTLTGLLAGCAVKPPPPPAPPNPFGYLKRSAVCTTGPISRTPEGQSVTMSTRSDDGLCGIAVSQPEGGAYASFLLTTLPAHGNSFIYNYNKQTYVTYTASTAYAGPDSFAVSLVPGGGKPRSSLKVDVSVDATGVALPPPPPPAAAAKPVPKTHGRSRSKAKVVRHHKPTQQHD
jgi:hypothetical protein